MLVCKQLRGDQDKRHNELLEAVQCTTSPDNLQRLSTPLLLQFLQEKRCHMAAQQVNRLQLNGYALAGVVDGLGWRTSTTGHFMLAQWLTYNNTKSYADACDEIVLLVGAVAEMRATPTNQ